MILELRMLLSFCDYEAYYTGSDLCESAYGKWSLVQLLYHYSIPSCPSNAHFKIVNECFIDSPCTYIFYRGLFM